MMMMTRRTDRYCEIVNSFNDTGLVGTRESSFESYLLDSESLEVFEVVRLSRTD